MSAQPSPSSVVEGKASFDISGAFFRPSSRTGRDLAVLAAAVLKQRRGQLNVLDTMTGCGVRPLRYCLEAGADWIWANEGNPELAELVRSNLRRSLPASRYRISCGDAQRLLLRVAQEQQYFDLVDIDSFGSPMPYLATALGAVRREGLLYLTATDGRATSGRDRQRSIQTYGSCARSHPAVQEQGLRLLLGRAMQEAAARGWQVRPVFSLFNGQVGRVMVQLGLQPQWQPHHYGFLTYCHRCGQFGTADWSQLGQLGCSGCHHPPVVSGPLWLGPLHSCDYLEAMRQLAEPALASLLAIMIEEAAMPPYYYPLAEIGARGRLDVPKRDRLIAALCDRGYRASRTHISPQAFKTTASLATCITVARQCR